MQPVQCSLAESETPQRQSTDAAHPALSVSGNDTSNEKEQSDRQFAAETMYAAFVWLFGSGCY